MLDRFVNEYIFQSLFVGCLIIPYLDFVNPETKVKRKEETNLLILLNLFWAFFVAGQRNATNEQR